MGIPCEEFGNGIGTEDWRFVAIGDTGDIGLYVVVLDDRDELFERVAVGVAVKAVSPQVLDPGTSGEDLGQDTLLDVVGVVRNVFDELDIPLFFLRQALVRAAVHCFFRSFRHGF